MNLVWKSGHMEVLLCDLALIIESYYLSPSNGDACMEAHFWELARWSVDPILGLIYTKLRNTMDGM